MLVLKRKKNTAIISTTGMRLEVVEIAHTKAFLAIKGPSSRFGLWLGMGESIEVEGHIEVTICGIEMGAIKLGVNAPKDCRILREELQDLPEGVLLGTIWAGK